MPSDTVPVDVAEAPNGWRVCHHQPVNSITEDAPPATDFLQFVKSQPKYISQYYKNIKCEIPAEEMYTLKKTTPKIIMATVG